MLANCSGEPLEVPPVEGFERPALVRLADGRWRLYVSCATPGSKHWWVDSLTAATVEELLRAGSTAS